MSFDETKFIGTSYHFRDFLGENSGSDKWWEESASADSNTTLSYEVDYKSDNHDAINVDDQEFDEHQICVSMTEADIDSGNQYEIVSFDNNYITNYADSDADAKGPSRRPSLRYSR